MVPKYDWILQSYRSKSKEYESPLVPSTCIDKAIPSNFTFYLFNPKFATNPFKAITDAIIHLSICLYIDVTANKLKDSK